MQTEENSGKESDIILDVHSSVSGLLWRSMCLDTRASMAISQANEIPEVVARAIVGRGIANDEVDTFLNPTIRELMPDPLKFCDMKVAVLRLVEAIYKNELIAVFGDYDVDGATSGAILLRYLDAVGGRCISYVPDRSKEGYGPNTNAMKYLDSAGANIVITVDCGISSFEPLSEAKKLGLDVVVIDHHVAEARLPEAIAVVNPNRLDEQTGFGELAAVGVTFLLVVALNSELRKQGRFSENNKWSEPDLLTFLDLVALGTVCDVVPLIGLNRAFVKQGLKVMGWRKNIGITALSDIAEIDTFPNTYHAGFVLGPRLNAGGRVGEPSLGTRLLVTNDRFEADSITKKLEIYNNERKLIESDILDAAINQVMEREADNAKDPIVFAAGEGWHPGVTGIVASRLKEKFERPSIVIAFHNDIGKASCRSIYGVDIGSAVTAARQAGLIINGGGHKMAAGFSLKVDKLKSLSKFINERLAESVKNAIKNRCLDLDGVISVEGANLGLIDKLEQLGPFGAGNSEPKFAIARARISRSDIVGDGHVRCNVLGETGGKIQAIAFRCADTALGNFLLANGDTLVHLAGYLRVNHWRGRNSAQFILLDAAPCVSTNN